MRALLTAYRLLNYSCSQAASPRVPKTSRAWVACIAPSCWSTWLILGSGQSVGQSVSSARGQPPPLLARASSASITLLHRMPSLFQNGISHTLRSWEKRPLFPHEGLSGYAICDPVCSGTNSVGRLDMPMRRRPDWCELDVLAARGCPGHRSEVAFSLPLPCLRYTLRVFDLIWSGVAAYGAQNTRPYIHPDTPVCPGHHLIPSKLSLTILTKIAGA